MKYTNLINSLLDTFKLAIFQKRKPL